MILLISFGFAFDKDNSVDNFLKIKIYKDKFKNIPGKNYKHYGYLSSKYIFYVLLVAIFGILIYFLIYSTGRLNGPENKKRDKDRVEERCKGDGINLHYETCSNNEILKMFNQIIIKKGSRIPAKRTEKSMINTYQMLNSIRENINPQYKITITEGLSDTEVVDDVEKVWDKSVTAPKTYLDIDTLEENFNEYYDAAEIETTYKIDKNQVFEVLVKHVKTNTILINEKISMLDGSLNTNSSSSTEDLDDFEIK